MRRLSIIDLVTGHQPIENEDCSAAIFFNGEIYNFAALRRQIEATGKHVFRTNTDTEVILHLYEEHGCGMPALLHGMFAVAIYDRREGALFLARDRFGEKPLYYATRGREISFSSEIDSLLRSPSVSRAIDYEALYYLLHVGSIPAPLTLFREIKQLPPGHWMRWEGGKLAIQPFYRPAYQPDPALADEGTAVEALRESLLECVRNQMVADVPLGAFLSGGIDSSTIVAAMQHVSSRPVSTFTARFEYAPFDESAVARSVAEHLGTEHHEIVISNNGFEEADLSRIIRRFGQPFLDSSAIPTYFVSREIRKHVKVALSGDGGDEVFAGYTFFQDLLKVDRLSCLPGPAIDLAHATFGLVSSAPGLRDLSLLRRLRRATELASVPANLRPGILESVFGLGELSGLASPRLEQLWHGISDTATEQILDSVSGASRLRQLMHYRLKFSLPEDMLAKVDRMSMAVSLEVRAPLLSVVLTDLAARLPDRLLIRDGVKKYILREVGRPWLPKDLYRQPKKGFSIPLDMFQNDAYNALCRRYVSENSNPIMGELFDYGALRQVVARGAKFQFAKSAISVRRATHQLWALLQLGAWSEMYGVEV